MMRPLPPRAAAFLLGLIGVSFLARQAPAQLAIAGKPYVKLETRQATEDAMLRALTGVSVKWGPWHLLAPLDHPKGGKDIATVYPPESQLPSMRPGAADAIAGGGPDLSASYAGKGGKPITWRTVEQEQDIGGLGGLRPLDLAQGLQHPADYEAVGYLYRTVTADAAAEVPVAMGSDDGLRCWLNGELIVDANAERSLDPTAHHLRLPLHAGVNHLFIKVSQGRGEWQFAMTPEMGLEPAADAALQYQLDSDFPDDETRYYRIATVPVPADIVLEVGGLDVLPPGAPGGDARPIVSTRRGDVFIVNNAYELPPVHAAFTRFAGGLHEPLGLAVRRDEQVNGHPAVYVVQRAELTRLVDTNGDDAADIFETVCDEWKLSGNYHEFAFGPKFDRLGNAWITLNLAHTGGETVMGATVPTRGWAIKVPLSGAGNGGGMIKVADGLRSPDGIGMYSDGQMFYTDNQGDFVATNKLSPLYQDSFHGHQASLKFRPGWENWKKDGKPLPDITPAAVWFPYKKMGQSASDILLDDSAGKFGPFSGQLFIGDQTHATVMRVCLEKIDGVYQGACFPFKRNFESGVHRLAWGGDHSMFVGMTDRGWGSTGPKRFGLQRLVWTGRTPFEIQHMKATPDGFELRFTRPVDPTTATNAASYRLISYTYEYHPEYGSPEIDTAPQTVASATLADRETVRLVVERLKTGYVHELDAAGVRSIPGPDGPSQPLLHSLAYYTLQKIPGTTPSPKP